MTDPAPTPSATESTPPPTPRGVAYDVDGGHGQVLNEKYLETGTFTLTREGGYIIAVTVSVGTPAPIGPTSKIEVLGSQGTGYTVTAGQTCTVDKATDAAIPIVVSLQNQTTGFKAAGAYELHAESTVPVQIEENFSRNEGPTCNGRESGNDSADTSLATLDMVNGATTAHPLLLILHGYYSPAAPDGDRDLLGRTSLAFSGANDADGNALTAGDPKGPRAQTNGDQVRIALAN